MTSPTIRGSKSAAGDHQDDHRRDHHRHLTDLTPPASELHRAVRSTLRLETTHTRAPTGRLRMCV